MTLLLLRRKIFRSARHTTHEIVTDENHSTSRGVRSAGLVRRIFESDGFSRTLGVTLLIMVLACGAGGLGSATPLDATHARTDRLRGPQPFATILCKFADAPAEPDPVAYFARLLGNAYPGLDHYWREVSYGAISLDGSTVTGWHELPHSASHYLTGLPNSPVPTQESPVDLQRLAEDCVRAADAAIEPSQYVGINLIFNIDLDRPRGGEVCLPQDGASRCFRATWLWPAWYHNQSIWTHEMGHTFSLQHSSVGNGNGYGNMWDVMSVDGPCRTEPGYGRIGQHPIAYQKDVLDWIPAERIFVAAPHSQTTITLEQTALPASSDYLLARIPITGSSAGKHYYTVEARRRTGYDTGIPSDAVIIHEVNLADDPQVRLVSTAKDCAGIGLTTGSAARWLPGQRFRDAEYGIAVSIERATPTGFVVTIYTGPLPAALLASESEATTVEDVAVSRFSARQTSQRTRPIALAAGNYTYALWLETQTEASDGFMSAGSTRSDIYASRRPNEGDWEPAIRINDDGRDSRSNPALAVDRQGNTYAAWVDYRDGDAAIYAATRPAGGDWGKNARVSSGAADGYAGLAIIVDWDGAVHVSWEGLDRCGGEAILGGGE